MKRIKIALTWWSTWGHIFPLVSIYNYLEKDNNHEFLWVWEEWWLEEDISKKNNIKFLDIASGKIRRYFDWKNFYEPLKNLTGIFQWIYYILRYKIDIIISKWGFVSLPLCIAGKILGKKIYIHESDMITGLSNRIISKIATKVFYTFENNLIDWDKYILSGPIINPEIVSKMPINIEENEKLEVLVIWGSQWASKIFDAVLKISKELKNINFHIVLGTKNTWFKDDFSKILNVKTYDFLSQWDLGKLMTKVDIAITRWSSTLRELYFFGIHSIIIPLPNSASDHQMKNAKYFAEKFKSDLLLEDSGLSLEIFRKLNKYFDYRKTWLNIEWYDNALKIISKDINDIFIKKDLKKLK